MKKRVTIIHCQRCGKEVTVPPRGRVPAFCLEHAAAGRKAKSRSSPDAIAAKLSTKARRQLFANERFARKHPSAAFSLPMGDTAAVRCSCRVDCEVFLNTIVVELPRSEGRWHIQPIFHDPGAHPLLQPSSCGRWDGEVHAPNFEDTHEDTAKLEGILASLGMPPTLPPTLWGRATQLSVLLEKEAGISTIDGLDVSDVSDDVWQGQDSVVESLDVAESFDEDAVTGEVVESAPVVEEPEGAVEDQEEDDTEQVIDNSKTDEDTVYELATSVQLRLAKWWWSRHQNEEPLNLRLTQGRRCHGRYEWMAPGGSRLDFGCTQVQHEHCFTPLLIGPRLVDGSFFKRQEYRPWHPDGRWCPCEACVAARKVVPDCSDKNEDVVYVSRWSYMIRPAELITWDPIARKEERTDVGELVIWNRLAGKDDKRTFDRKSVDADYRRWLLGEDWKPNAKNAAAADVVNDKYVFNGVRLFEGKAVILMPELIRQGDLDVLAKCPETLVFAFQRRRCLEASLDWKRLPTTKYEKKQRGCVVSQQAFSLTKGYGAPSRDISFRR